MTEGPCRTPSGHDRDFELTARLVRESLLFPVAARVARATTSLLAASVAATTARAWARRSADLGTAARMRLTGLFLLFAATTNAVLLLLVPREMAPAWPFALPSLVAIISVILIIASSSLSEAWSRRGRE